ncbi:MAG: preprotein translocase subunit SecY [Chloroflexi bacterium]|nr:preprotein translocase subunit SecY [Chloroflexota bacterium]MBM3173314.1 preprotein translocase subunit SecY [Chloroflexota bacterium]MBM3174471.1 preprotein translocase subunit SecY [Chloroflexota bacterium]MBM4449579.1 preprotein translocase subunit SecY [Chloroflexota bacterium]
MIQALKDAFSLPDLRQRLLFTFGMLVVFRFVAHVPMPGVDPGALAELFEKNQLLGMLDLFSGGAMRNFSVAAMGVYPYITASIIMQLMVPVIPQLRALSEEGEAGRRRINQITHWLMVPMAALQGYAQIALLRNQGVITEADALATLAMITSLVTGTVFLVWLGELITERGIGNGVSIIIFGGIVAGLPEMIGRGMIAKENWIGVAIFAIFALAIMFVIVVFTEAHRRIPVQYAKTAFRGARMYRQSGSTFIPLRVNTAGMIPLIFAMSLVIFPGTVASYFAAAPGQEPNFASKIVEWFSPNAPLPLGFVYWGLYFLMVIAFAFFYTMVIFEQMNLARTLQRQGGFIPGVRPGKPTTDYLNKVISRITWGGALFLAFIAITPFFVREITDVGVLTLSSTGLLIVVGVALDTMKQIEAQLTMRRYEGFLR